MTTQSGRRNWSPEARERSESRTRVRKEMERELGRKLSKRYKE